MGHTVYISFKTEDEAYKDAIQSWDHLDYVDRSLNEAINSDDRDYIMRTIREQYLRNSTVTIFLIGTRSAEDLGADEQYYVKRELQASLYNGSGNTKSGILGIVLPEMTDRIYGSQYTCATCGATHNGVYINNSTAIAEFAYNYYIPVPAGKCSWREEDRYCVLVKWEDFALDPDGYIEAAFEKRSAPIAAYTKVQP